MARPTNALIVDDEPHVRVFVRTLLKEAGITQTWEAVDGVQAIAMMREHAAELVMLDINLPIMNGLEVLQALHRERPELPLIMLSSQSSMKTVLECVKHGAAAYLLKHSPPAETLQRLREALDELAADDSAEPT
jgi:CheY-like chemotaxis protein